MFGLLARAVDAALRRSAVLGRYLMVSVVNVINHQALLQLALWFWGVSGGVANTFAAMVNVIPSYLLSRRWVWQVKSVGSSRFEVGAFWMIALAGLVVSTAFAELADRLFGQPMLVSVGSLAGYLLVWIAKFMILDLLFRDSADGVAGVDGGDEGPGGDRGEEQAVA